MFPNQEKMPSGYIRLRDISAGSPDNEQPQNEENSGTECQSDRRRRKMGQPAQLYLVALTAAMGGLLFGYDTGVVSGGIILIKKDFDLSEDLEAADVAVTPATAMLFAMVGGLMGNKFGRKITIIVASIIFIAGTAILTFATDQIMFIIGRVIVGAAIGLASMIVPLYLAECSPDSIRGTLVTMNQMMITLGILLANILDAAFTNTPHGWRYAFGIGAAPALVMGLGMFFSPASPRFLVMKGKVDEARKCLDRLRNKDHDKEGELEGIIKMVEEEKKAAESVKGNVYVEMFKNTAVKRALLLGCLLQFFQQFSGINTVMYYGGTILLMAGISPDQATTLWYSCIIFATNFVMAFPGMILIEKLGRRVLTIASLLGITVTMFVIGGTFQASRADSEAISYNNGTILFNSTINCADAYPVGSFCTPCTDDPDCGFCYMKGDDALGACVNIYTEDHINYGAYGRCTKEGMEANDDLVFSSDYCMAKPAYGAIIMVGLILYLCSFSAGIACTAWAVNAEIYPLWARSSGVSIATAVNWGINVVVSVSFPYMRNPNHGLGPNGAFYFFGAWGLLGLITVIILQPETKGKSMEEMEEVFSVPLHQRQRKK